VCAGRVNVRAAAYGVLGAYKQVLLTPHALPMVAVGFIGRLPLSMVGLGCLLVVEDYTGSYALGGAVAATGAVTTSIFGPLLGRAADAFGQRRVLLPILAVFVVSGTTFLWAVRKDQPKWIMFLAAGVAGACIPPISSMAAHSMGQSRRRAVRTSSADPPHCG